MRAPHVFAAAVAAAAAAPASPAGADRRGEVVRVERSRLAAAEVRVCPIIDFEGKATCFGGAQPAVGSVFWFIGVDGALGRARVVRSERSAVEGSCAFGGAHDLYFDASEFFDSGAGLSRLMVAVGGVDVGPDARLVFEGLDAAPSGRSDETIWIGLDRDGDGVADFVATERPCPETAPPVGASAPVMSHCIGYWLRDRRGWRQLGAHTYHRCT